MEELLTNLEKYFACPKTDLSALELENAKKEIGLFLQALECGELRAASKVSNGAWKINTDVKKGILLAFKLGEIVAMGDESLPFADKDLFAVQKFDIEKNIRVVPGGSSVRRGSCVGDNVTIMPPAYVNVGAFIDDKTMIDSHALVGSCAQIGKRVHLSAAAQIGGVLEPIGAMPVIIENDCLIGGNTGIYEGTIVRERAVIAAGVVLTNSTSIFDVVNENVIAHNESGVLEVPPNAVVISGSRQMRGSFAKEQGLTLSCPIIVKYRDQKTDAKTALEECLR